MKTNKCKVGGLLLIAACAVACFQGSTSDDVSLSKSISFDTPPVPAAVGLNGQTLSAGTSVDISSALSNLSNIGNLTLSIPTDSLSSSEDLSWVQHITITVQPEDNDMPPATLVDTNVSATNSINLPTVLSSDEINQYFSESGGVNVNFALTGTLPTSFTSNPSLVWNLTVHANISINKSL